MKKYIGTKLINAKPMTRATYNVFRGWVLPVDENGNDAGFLVEYINGGKANTSEYAGYVSWSPFDVFERAYRLISNGMSFGDAIESLKAGHKVCRAGWNGKGMWLILIPARDSQWEGHTMQDCIGMKTVQGTMQPGWLASQADMLAEDWEISE